MIYSKCSLLLRSLCVFYVASFGVQIHWITRLSVSRRTTSNETTIVVPELPTWSRTGPWVQLQDTFDPSQHNQTLEGQRFPGLFWEKRLWLLGARLTTLHDEDGVYLTLFGMPGDFHKRFKKREVRCPSNHWYNQNGTLLSYPEARQRVHLSVSLHNSPVSVPMEFIRTLSADVHQNNVTLVWHANLHDLGISKTGLQQQSLRTALQLQVWVAPASDSAAQSLFSLQIPLSTGVVGQGGPVVTAPERSSLVSTPTMDAAVCVAIYGDNAVQYLPEFILHHTNVGFGQVVVGVMDGRVGSPEMARTQEALQDFVSNGLVTIAAMDLPELDCEVNVRKQHFYNTCLYHTKGIAKYVGIWDVDEYWIPPRPDKFRGTDYASSMTVGKVMAAIQLYQERAGCGSSWCYNSFPSYPVYLRRSRNDDSTWSKDWTERTGSVGHDFHMRSEELDWDWAKSISRTKHAYMGGLHQVGSCWMPEQGRYMTRREVEWNDEAYSDDTTCRNLLVESFGTMHHYISLNRVRQAERKDFRETCADSCAVDEYVHYYAATVQRQLEQRRHLKEQGLRGMKK